MLYDKVICIRHFDIPIWECPKSELCLHVTYYDMRMSQIGIIYIYVCISVYMFIYIDYFKEIYMRNFDIPIWECPKSELCLHV